jgi:hypothetical protein
MARAHSFWRDGSTLDRKPSLLTYGKYCRLENADRGQRSRNFAIFRTAQGLLMDDSDHLLAIFAARDGITEVLMNIRNINSTSEDFPLLTSQNMDTLSAGSMVIESTDISPFAVMAQLRRLRRSDPKRFKAVISSISSTLFSRTTTFSQATDDVGGTSEIDKTFLMAPQTRRWPVAMLAGVAVVGIALLMLLRPGHQATQRSATGLRNIAHASARIRQTTALDREEALKDTEPSAHLAISGETNADSPALLAVAGARPVSMPLVLAATSRTSEAEKSNHRSTRRTPSTPTAKKWNSDERWLAH